MISLNEANGAQKHTLEAAASLLTRFSDELIGVEMGIAWGGGVEALARLWKGRGQVHGFDTFEGHPDGLSYDQKSHEARCVDMQYAFNGRSGLTYHEQITELERLGLTNAHLHKGLIGPDSLNGIDKIHYCLLDMDLLVSMALGYQLVKDKIVPGGILCLHDVVPRGHIFGLWGLYQEILSDDRWKLAGAWEESYLVVLERVK